MKKLYLLILPLLLTAFGNAFGQTTIYSSGFETTDPAFTYLAGTINTPAVSTSTPRTGSRCGSFSANGKYDGAFVTGAINFVSCRTYTITCYYKVATCAGSLNVYMTTDNSSYAGVTGGTSLVSVTTNQVAYTAVSTTFTATTTQTAYIGFVATMSANGCNSANFWLDDVVVTEDAGAPSVGTASASLTSISCGGNTTSLSLTSYTGSLTWQTSANNSTWSDMPATTNPYTATVYSTAYFRAKVVKNCATVYSNSVMVSVTGSNTKTWLTNGTSSWTTASNWSPSGVPTSCDDVTIPSGGTQPTLTGTGSCRSLTVNSGANLIITASPGAGVLSIYGNLTNNGNINDANGYVDLYGTGNTWGGTGTFMNGASQAGWVRIKNGANYTLTSSGITVYQLNPGGPASTGSLSLGSNTIVITNSLYNTFYLHYNTGMVDLRGGGSIDVAKSDYGTGTLWVNSSVNNFNFNLEDDYYNVWFSNSAGTTLFGSSALDVYVSNNMWIKTGTLSMSGAGTNAVHVGGDFTNDASFVGATATITMDGSQAQNIQGTSVTTFNNLTINNSTSSGVTMQQDENVSGILTLTKAPLWLNQHKLTIQNNAATAITRTNGCIVSETNASVNNSIVQWNMGTTTGAHVYPFGASGSTSDYIPFTFNKTSGTAANISVSTRATGATNNTPWAGTSNLPAVSHMYDPTIGGDGSVQAVVDRWWDITTSASVTADLVFTYRGVENTLDPLYNTGPLGAQHWNGTGWDPPVGSGTGITSGTGTVSVSGASTFSPWIVSSATAPLPIQIVSFTAQCDDNDNVIISWVTASETNNDYFSLERSFDGINYEVIATVKGAGTSTSMKNYSVKDANATAKDIYYRLRQTDLNGASSYSNIISASKCGSDNNELYAVVTPNDIMLVFSAPIEEDYTVTVYEVTGRKIMERKITGDKGINSIQLPREYCTPGMYLLTLQSSQQRLTTKVIIH